MKRFFLVLAACLALAPAVDAQRANPYGVAIRVNDGVITNYEIDQRVLLLRAFGTSGDLQKTAQDQLIDDRLRVQAARSVGLTLTEEEIEAGIDEFAQRGGLNGAQLYQYIQSRGAAKESMQAFVRAGLLWRNLVQARFGPRASVSEREIDTALTLATSRDRQSVLISEIRIPLNQSNEAATMELAERLSREIKSEAAFGAAARRHSRAPSRARSGRLDWVPVSNLPAQLAGQIMALNPGEVSAPVALGPTVGLFQLRGIRTDARGPEQAVSVTYVNVVVPSSDRADSEAVELINDVDTCADLRAQSERFAVPGHTDHSEEVAALPDNIRLAVAGLDPNEATYYTNSAGGVSVLMLCSRLTDLPEGARENIRNALFQQRVSGFGQGYLQELKGDAVITYQ